MPLIQSDTSLYTFQDVVEHLLDYHEIGRDGLNQRNARRAILNVHRDLPNRTCWTYYNRQRLLQTVASQSSSTVTYDHTGGTYERELTLASGTWPTWSALGRVIIDGVHYEVEDRKSDTVITLEADSNPGADVGAGTSYTLYRNAYPLPADFLELAQIWDVDQERRLNLADPLQQHDAQQSYYKSPSTPFDFTIRATGDYLGSLSLIFSPPPDAVRTYDLLYKAAPRRLRIDQYNTGTVAVSGTSVTGTGTTFPTDCVGSVIRFSGNGTVPTGIMGGMTGLDNRFIAQCVIKARTSGTALVLEETPSAVVPSGAGFVISDPVDVEPGAMMSAYLRMCEAELMYLTNRQGWEKQRAVAQQELRYAMEADQRAGFSQRPIVFDRFKHTNISTRA